MIEDELRQDGLELTLAQKNENGHLPLRTTDLCIKRRSFFSKESVIMEIADQDETPRGNLYSAATRGWHRES